MRPKKARSFNGTERVVGHVEQSPCRFVVRLSGITTATQLTTSNLQQARKSDNNYHTMIQP
jgi:hypothetical protein